ncbi:MAG: Peptide chain release factor subunit 1 [Candidatus Heimdallarchaeota archaeon LC_3]|nr:MAG: Peptide chain release factor subunit 1 [Candidatus Heimdallarchaeota archaeon LC_3]
METLAEENSFEKYKLRKSLDTLRNKRSEDGTTCLVTLYIPENRALSDFTQQLNNEIGTAANIKSKTTKKNVQEALQISIGKLRLIGQKSPKNGLALFIGRTENGRMDKFVISPATPITRQQYICDSYFHIDHLEEHLLKKKLYGLIALDAGYSTVGTLQGNHIKILKAMRSTVPKKHSRGGQSAPRFGRIRQNAIDEFLKRVAGTAKDFFIEDPSRAKLLAGALIGGPGLLKNKFVEDGYLDNRLQNKVLKVIDIGLVSDKEGLQELVEKSQEVLAGTRFTEEREIVQKWLNLVYKDDDLAVYGEDELRKYLDIGAVDLLLGSEGVNKTRLYYECPHSSSHENIAVTVPTMDVIQNNYPMVKCKECDTTMQNTEEKDLLEDLGELALETSTDIEIISTETEEGQQLLHFSGIAGILRYLPTD